MTESIQAKGHCLCGAVSIEAQSMSTNVGACHCNMCRRWAGGPLLAVDCKNDVNISGLDSVSVYSSSDWAERGFCSACGTHLFYRIKHNGQYMIPVGFFELASDLHFDQQIFIDEKPAYYCFSNVTKNMTGPEVFAAYTGK